MLNTGNTISNAGLLEATAGGTLDIQDSVNNSGLLEASGGSTLDVTGSTISWVGASPASPAATVSCWLVATHFLSMPVLPTGR